MTVRKLSVALDERVAGAVAHAARNEGVSLSAWLSRAAQHELSLRRGLEAVAAWELDHGALSEKELRDADALLDRLLGTAKRRIGRRPRSSHGR